MSCVFTYIDYLFDSHQHCGEEIFFLFGNCITHEFVHLVTMEPELTPKAIFPLCAVLCCLQLKRDKVNINNKILTVRREILIK